MAAHVTSVCPAVVVPCKYEHVGCDVKVRDHEMCFFLCAVMSSKDANEISKVLSLVFQVRRDALQQHEETSMKRHLDLACAKLKELEVGCYRFNCVPYIWKVSHFGKILQEAKQGKVTTIRSDPIYNSPQGYKMEIHIIPNGNGKAKDSHLSVYLFMMKGEYDSILSWPFQQEITFTLIDQQQQEGNRKDLSTSFKADASEEFFGRPVHKVNDAGRGFPRFVSHEVLQTRRYVVDDTIFLKIEVSPCKKSHGRLPIYKEFVFGASA